MLLTTHSTAVTAGVVEPAGPANPILRLQSYNLTDRYLRHYDYQLRLDQISTATGRADATFRMVG